jgi:hypothetical protein
MQPRDLDSQGRDNQTRMGSGILQPLAPPPVHHCYFHGHASPMPALTCNRGRHGNNCCCLYGTTRTSATMCRVLQTEDPTSQGVIVEGEETSNQTATRTTGLVWFHRVGKGDQQPDQLERSPFTPSQPTTWWEKCAAAWITGTWSRSLLKEDRRSGGHILP